MIKLFLKFELGKTAKYFKTKTLAKSITSFLFMLVFLFVGTGIYFFFTSGFRSINAESTVDIRLALTLFLYESFLLILAGVVVFSAAISSIFSLFRGGYNNWILSSPGYKIFPKVTLMKSLMTSALPLLIMFLPMVLAFIKVNNLGFFSLIFVVLSVVLFLLLLNASTLLAIVLVSYAYYTISQKVKSIRFTIGGLIITLLSLITLIISLVWRTFTNIDLVKLFRADEVSDSLSVQNIGSHFNFLPTHPFAMEILNWQNGQIGEALLNFSLLLLLAFVSVFLWWTLSFLFYPLWQKFQEGSSQRNKESGTFHLPTRTYYFTGGKTMALFKKEALISSRNWKGVLWFVFLSCIWLAQIGTNVALGHNIQKYETDISHKMVTLQALQFIIAIYFISSFALRFVFPSFSIEKKTAWILASAPLSFKKIFFGKYLFYTSFFVIVGILMSCINISILNLSFIHAFYSMLLFVSTIIFIVTLGLSLGAIFPSLDTDDPEVITTSMPGLFFTALALIYGALSDLMLYLTLTQGNVFWLITFVIFTYIFIGVFLVKVPRIATKKAYR